jgi:hypothetical protein
VREAKRKLSEATKVIDSLIDEIESSQVEQPQQS